MLCPAVWLQIYGVARDLMKHHSQTHGVVMGGANRRAEAEKLVKGVSLLVSADVVGRGLVLNSCCCGVAGNVMAGNP